MTSTATHTKKRHLWFLLLGIPVVLGAALCGLRAYAQDGGMGMGPMFGGGSPEQRRAEAGSGQLGSGSLGSTWTSPCIRL